MKAASLPSPPLLRANQRDVFWRSPHSATAQAWYIAQAVQAHPHPLLLITQDNQSAQHFATDLQLLLADSMPVINFPGWETLPYDQFSPHPEIASQRLAALQAMPELKRGIVVVAIQTAMQRVAPQTHIYGARFQYTVGQTCNLEEEKQRLINAGYRNVQQAIDPGDFAVRGGIIDVYPMGGNTPLRLEFFDNQIDSIRTFDPETQRSLENIPSINLLPGREIPLDGQSIALALQHLRERFDLDTRRSPLYQDLKAGVAPAGIEYYLPLFFPARKDNSTTTVSIFDYLDPDILIVLTSRAYAAAETFWEQTHARYEQRSHDVQRPLLAPQELYQSPVQMREKCNQHNKIVLCDSAHAQYEKAHDLQDLPLLAVPINQRHNDQPAPLQRFIKEFKGRVLIATDTKGRREALREVLHGIDLSPVVLPDFSEFIQRADVSFAIAVAGFEDGFVLTNPSIAVLTERQLFPERATATRKHRRKAREAESIIRDLDQLSEGSPIVHEDHGVGRYRGLIMMEVGGIAGEFLDIEYAKGDRLYVPVTQLHLINRYCGASEESAPLHSLGGEQWVKAKRKAMEKVRDVAAELLDIQARRQAQNGVALHIDRTLYEPFAANFPFEETPDQLSAIEATLRDLTHTQPMDRVVCGDVGFGKTEVALRAAFAAVTAGKQVAVLVPTTLLAEQHHRNFRDRFADWPVRVEVLSRFKSSKQIKTELSKVNEGAIDIIIGTHRLLQPDVAFKDLGLVIVDEEQRFGVRQKEKLKALRANVHLLTLTATPIPRTLNMAMSSLRDLSIIATPPPNRLAVQTFITIWDSALLKEAFLRELARGGQVYFLHNDVQSMARMQQTLQELIPEARIAIAHGQMHERDLERVMLDFQKQQYNVLLSTTIIESGIDIPNANTIIINRADCFGLAQLHQLRGRVGRSHHRAYAYLLVPENRVMTADAQKRLEAIASIDTLGSGFTLAIHDLEIRGAGELLGEDQSGQMSEIGFSMYTELLDRTVKSLRAGTLPETGLEQMQAATDVQLHIPALIPDEYIPDVHTRLTLYKRISSTDTPEELRELQVEMIDRFGLLPEPTKNLFTVAEFKQQAIQLGISKLELGEQSGRLVFEKKPKVDPSMLIQLIQKQPTKYTLDGPDTLRIKQVLADPADRCNAARGLLMALSPSN